MLTRLLESKAKRDRSVAGAVASVAMHTAFIGVAIYATAQARVEAAPPSHIVHPFYFPPPRLPSEPQHTRGLATTVARTRLVFVDPAIKVSLPTIDVPLPAVGSDDFRRDPLAGVGSLWTPDPAHGGSDGSFRADQVEHQVSVISGTPPKYPEILRLSGIEGEVLARFVVGEDGRVEEGTVKIVRSGNHLFDDAVRSALALMRFTPAAIGGKNVRQLVEMPFVFTLAR